MSASGANSVPAKLDQPDWDRIAESDQFQDLLAIKRLFIVPALIFFLMYYFLLPILVGYAPRLMGIRVIGTVTVAYLFALSQFVMGWLIAWLYLKASARFDRLTQDILEKVEVRQGGK